MLLHGISISILSLLYCCNRGYLSTATEICGANRGKMGVNSDSGSNFDGFSWIWMDLDGSGWIWMDLNGFLWICMDLYGFRRIWMDLDGFE